MSGVQWWVGSLVLEHSNFEAFFVPKFWSCQVASNPNLSTHLETWRLWKMVLWCLALRDDNQILIENQTWTLQVVQLVILQFQLPDREQDQGIMVACEENDDELLERHLNQPRNPSQYGIIITFNDLMMRFVRAASCNSEGSVSVIPQSLARLRRIELCCPSLQTDCERERLNHSLIKFFRACGALSSLQHRGRN